MIYVQSYENIPTKSVNLVQENSTPTPARVGYSISGTDSIPSIIRLMLFMAFVQSIGNT